MAPYQLLNCTIEAFRLDATALKDIESWPKWAIEARERDQRLPNSIYPTDPENPEKGYTINNSYGIVLVPQSGWITKDQHNQLSVMEDIHFTETYEIKDGEEKDDPKKPTLTQDPKKPSAAAAAVSSDKTAGVS
jgi:hypothetical protein